MDIKYKRPILIGLGIICLLIPVLSQSVPLGIEAQLNADTVKANSIFHQQSNWIEEGQPSLADFEKIKEAQDIYLNTGLWDKYIECFILSAKLSSQYGYELKSSYANKALDAIDQYLPDAQLLKAKAIYQKAEGLIGLGMADSSFYYFDQAMPVFKKFNQWKDLVYCKLLIAANYINAEKYDSCETHLKLGLEIIEQHQVENKLKAGFYNMKGILY